MKNLIIQADNIIGLNYLVANGYLGKIDLIYIDPPFATGNDFAVGEGRIATISHSKSDIIAYTDRVKGDEFVESIRKLLLIARELLSERGSIYLHTDYKIGHYLKVMMDDVFGASNFRNDISRIKCNPKNFKRIGFGNIKDMILFYTKAKAPIWNEPFENYSAEDVERLFPYIDDSGRRYTTVPIHAPGEKIESETFHGLKPPKGRHWRTSVKVLEQWDKEGLIEWSKNGNPRKKIFIDDKKGKRMQDIWTFKDPQYPTYPTEKNANLLDLIIRTSSVPGSIVLDFYMGSGTTLAAAKRNSRKWIGIDASTMAIKAAIKKLQLNESSLWTEDYEFVDLTE